MPRPSLIESYQPFPSPKSSSNAKFTASPLAKPRLALDLGQGKECLVWPGVAGRASVQTSLFAEGYVSGAIARPQLGANEWGSGAFPYQAKINQNEA